MTQKRRVFISYQRAHEHDIAALVEVLEKDSTLDVWYDARIVVGEWWAQIIKQIEQADVVILALSRGYLTSEACRREYQHAEATRRAILPVIVDPDLRYETIPTAISKLQIEKYFGRADQYVKLQTNLKTIATHPLPDPLPEPPDAPNSEDSEGAGWPVTPVKADKEHRPQRRTRWMISLVITVVTFVAIAATLLSTNANGENGLEDETAVAAAGSVVVDETVPLVATGNFDITLIYGEQNNLTLLVNTLSNLSNVSLRTFNPAYITAVTGDFDALRLVSEVVEAGTCLVYEAQGTSSPRPLACSENQTFVMSLPAADVFWFNSNSNTYIDVAVYYDQQVVRLCPHANGSGRCDVTNRQEE